MRIIEEERGTRAKCLFLNHVISDKNPQGCNHVKVVRNS